jgi:hypothetical protein
MSDIGRALERDRSSIHYVARCHGGIVPAIRRRSRLALTLVEREDISRGIAIGWSIRSSVQQKFQFFRPIGMTRNARSR